MDNVLLTGSNGFLGKAVKKILLQKKIRFIETSKSQGLDLLNFESVYNFLRKKKIHTIINCSAFVGGIQFGYKYPAEIFFNNQIMYLNLLECSRQNGIKKIINPISNCAYPSHLKIFEEKDFWNGEMHETVKVYGLTRKAMVVGSEAYSKQYQMEFVNIVFSNMYGPFDHFDEERSHALGALIKKFYLAKIYNSREVVVWGSGEPVREWTYVYDAANLLVEYINLSSNKEIVNYGVEKGISIKNLAFMIKDLLKYEGEIIFDRSMPDGAKFKTVKNSIPNSVLNKLKITNFQSGLVDTINWFTKFHGNRYEVY